MQDDVIKRHSHNVRHSHDVINVLLFPGRAFDIVPNFMAIDLQTRKLHAPPPPPALPDSEKLGLFRIKIF